MPPIPDSDLQNIQGLGLGGYRKDQQHLLFVRFGDPQAARRLLAGLSVQIASAWGVNAFNQLFAEIKQRSGEDVIEATWLGLGISGHGYQKLGVDLTELGSSEGANAFQQGMANRSEQIGDTEANDAPAGWLDAFKPEAGVDAVIVIASDSTDDFDRRVDETARLVGDCGATVVFEERGGTLPPPLTGHEHFGFRDGVSQPSIDGFDPPPAPGEPAAVPAGEFVVGYPNALGETASVGDLWAQGSYLVFRRLRQDVAGFRAQAVAMIGATSPELSDDQVAAKLIGRWPSGAPVANEAADPGDTGQDNAFDYSNDPDGEEIPRFAHIRKANPRAEQRPDPPADLVAHHRMLRRGNPFGDPLPPGAPDDGAQRGLHFISVVADVDQQFEFVQKNWLNSENFPNGSTPVSSGSPYQPPVDEPPDGCDPVVGEHDPSGRSVALHQTGQIHSLALSPEVVSVTAGEYFFLPSISAVAQLGAGATKSTQGAQAAAA
jgi:Dyp-type peroxidase family